MFFERERYPDLVKWAQTSRHALYLEGPRQVGKSTILQKLGREHFKNCVYSIFYRKQSKTADLIFA